MVKRGGVETVEQFLAPHVQIFTDNPAHQQRISAGQAAITYLEYDWALNDVRP